jgi:hypothetical protein
MKIAAHSYEENAYACHGMTYGLRNEIKERLCDYLLFATPVCEYVLNTLNPCMLDPATQSLLTVLKEIQYFVQLHPTEMITLFLEDSFGNFRALANLFQESHLMNFVHIQNPNEPWPTLFQMLANRKQVVVFLNKSKDRFGNKIEDYPFFTYHHNFVWGSNYSYRSITALDNDDPYLSPHDSNAFKYRNHPPYNKLWVLQHFVTPTLGGSKRAAKQVNEKSFLKRRLAKYQEMLGSPPNFIWVDFFETPSLPSGIFSVVNEINSSSSLQTVTAP